MGSGGRPRRSRRHAGAGPVAARADRPVVGGGPESPTPWGRRARRGHARRAGQAAGGACARAPARPMRAPLWAAGPAARAQRGAAQGRSSVGPRRGAAWGCVGATQGRSRAGRRRGAAVWGRAGARRGAAQGRRVGLRRGGGDTACTLGGGGGCGLVGGCAREGDGGAVSSAAERHRVADRAEERPGLAKVGRGARGARSVRGAAVSGGARTPLGGEESR